MTITKMLESHVSQIAELEKLCFHDPWSENSISSEVDNKLSLWLVAIEDNRVIGYVGSQTVLGETDMMNIAVHPDHRKKGVATALINELVSSLALNGSHSLMLEVRASNVPAISVYTKMDFVEVGRRRNYYRKPREDALILRKEWSL